MKTRHRRMLAILLAAAIAPAALTLLRHAMAAESTTAPASKPVALPKLLDLGSTTCIPCKEMAPVLEELKKQYSGVFDVEFIDVNVKENLPKAKQYGIKLIPTQVFLDAAGKELWRHEGAMTKADILAKWKELRVELPAATGPATASAPAVAPARPPGGG